MYMNATIFHTATDSVTLFPDSLIPLNPADCMCSSLQALAQKLESIHPIVESDCVTTRNCTGVRCALNISADFTAMYFGEVVVLPCLNALEFLVENLQSQALIMDRFQGPINENSTIDIGGFPFIAGQKITVQDYSMTANSFLYGDGIGTIMVIPQQTIILDRTQCNVPEFPTVPMPTRLPPPQPVAPDASSVCVSLHKLAQDIYVTSPVFRCELNDACESGFTCVLNVVFTEYKVDIKITDNSVIFSIFSIDGKTSYGEFKGNTTFRLPEPRGAYLDFKQNVDGQKVGFMLQLRVSFLTTGQQTEELIPFTVIAFPPPQTMNTTNITVVVVTVVIAILLIIITVCVILLIAVLCLCKQKKSLSQGEPAFDFREMSDSKEGSRSLKTAVDGTLTTQGKGTKDGQEVDEEIKVDL
ncbi:uncharacterized protein LOC135343287 isoform X2 [Halichondria panicea]|uniref:uncharacterized protein LOC135343287 isoform X2 n=1 Tax=Halichondria panicea TaxID=6063 RepID=UPI00312BB5EC